jgi:hypothetical protein
LVKYKYPGELPPKKESRYNVSKKGIPFGGNSTGEITAGNINIK